MWYTFYMSHRTTRFIIVGVPLYVFFAFSTHALAPIWERVVHRTPEPVPQPITLTFVGDMMFDRFIREKATVHGYDAILADTRTLFASSTYVFGNLEGPITSFAPVSDYRDGGPNHYRFTFATATAPLLADYRFGAVTLSNNHILNFGSEGLAQTKEWLLRSGVGYVGAPDDPYTPWRTATSGYSIAVYAYSPWHTDSTDTLLARIASESGSTTVVVLAHWGEEYDSQPNAQEIALAHRLVDAGADLIVGSHPHVVQHKEHYAGVPIYYSLGNFVFDQYFSPAVRCGAVVSYTLLPDSTATTTEAFIDLSQNSTTRPGTCLTTVPTL